VIHFSDKKKKPMKANMVLAAIGIAPNT